MFTVALSSLCLCGPEDRYYNFRPFVLPWTATSDTLSTHLLITNYDVVNTLTSSG